MSAQLLEIRGDFLDLYTPGSFAGSDLSGRPLVVEAVEYDGQWTRVSLRAATVDEARERVAS